MNNLTKVSILAAAFFFLTSCGNYTQLRKDLAKGANGPATALEGTWRTTCASVSDGYYYSRESQYSGNIFQGTEAYFSDAQCKQQVWNGSYWGNFVIGAPSTQVAGATDIDFSYKDDAHAGQSQKTIFVISGNQLRFGSGDGQASGSRDAQINPSWPALIKAN